MKKLESKYLCPLPNVRFKKYDRSKKTEKRLNTINIWVKMERREYYVHSVPSGIIYI
jgi:hypothetical protein